MRRPVGIWIIVILQLFNAGVALVDVVAGTDLSGGQLSRLTNGDAVLRTLVLVWVALVMAGTISLFLLRRRGWALVMSLVGVSLFFHLATYWNDPAATQWVSMSVAAVTAFYLNSAAVRGLFVRHHEVSRITLGGRSDR